MESVDVVGLFPSGELLGQVCVVGAGERLVELELVGQVRALDLAVEALVDGLDADASDALVFRAPVELGLELGSVEFLWPVDP